MASFVLQLLSATFALCQLPPDAEPPAGLHGELVALMQTEEELTIVCPEDQAPVNARIERGWRAFRVNGPFDLTTTVGVLVALTVPIASTGTSVFALSTWNTDYLLVQQDRIAIVVEALEAADHRVVATDEID